jgi:hypothetical protein
MLGPRLFRNRSGKEESRRRAARPILEGLEQRLLLFSDLGDQWTYDSRITYSFMPDGTSIGGVPSVLFQTLNGVASTATWQAQIQQAAAIWENVTNVNLSLVSDSGAAVGVSGNQQDDSRFGDIRIGAAPLASGVLAETFLPPPANGGTDAGDIILNSNVKWGISSNYDVMTVAAHEFGHALGLGVSTVSTAVMYGTYTGIKQALASDDIAGIQSIYGTRQYDQFNVGGVRNNTVLCAANINSYITSNAQIAIPALDITTSGDCEWFVVNVPSSTTGTMSVSVQSSNLSSLAPKLQVFNSSLGLVGTASAPNTFGATITVSLCGVSASQQFYFKVLAAGGPGPIGGYGLLVNFGSQSQSPIPPPNTVVAQQPNQGGGTINNSQVQLTTIGSLSDWAVSYAASQTQPASPGNDSADSSASSAGPLDQVMFTPAILISPASGTQAAQVAATSAAIGPAPLNLQAVDAALEHLASSKTLKHSFGF